MLTLTLTLTPVTKPEGKVGSGTKKKKESIPLSLLGVRSPGRNGNEDEKHLGWRRGGSGNKRRLTQELIESLRGEFSKCSEERMNPSEKQIEIERERVESDKTNVSVSSSYSSTTRDDGGDDYTADPQALKRVLESSAFIAGSTNDQSIRDDDHTADPLALKRVLESSDFFVRKDQDYNEVAGNATVADVLNSSNDFLINELAEDHNISRPSNRRITADIDDVQRLLGGISDVLDQKKDDMTREILSIAKKDKNRRITADSADLNDILSVLDEDEEEGKRGGGSTVVDAVKSFPISQDTADMSGPRSAMVKPRPEDKESGSSSSGGGSNHRLTADISELRSVFTDVIEGEEQEKEAVSVMKPPASISRGVNEVEVSLEDKESGLSSSGGGSSRRLTADMSELKSMFADVMEGEEQEEESSDDDITAKWKKRFSSDGRADRRYTADMTEVKLVLAGLDEEISNATTTQQFPLPSPPSPPRGRFESNRKSPSSILVTASFTSPPVKIVREDTGASPPSVDNLKRSVDEANKEEEAMSNVALEENNGSPDPFRSGESQEGKSNTTCTQARRDSLHFLTDHFAGAVSEDMLLSPSGLAVVGTSSLKSCLSSKKRSRRLLPAPDMMDKSTPRKKPFAVEQDVGSGKRVGFGTLSAVEFRIGSPSTKLTPMPTRDAKAAFPLDGGQNDVRFAREVDDEDEDTATNTMILDEWEEEAKAAESLRIAQVEAAAAKRGSPSPSSRRGTLMPPRQKPFNVQGLVKNLQQEESFCDLIPFTDNINNDSEQQRSLVSLSDGSSSISVSASTCGTAVAASLPLPISMKVDNSRGCDGNDSSPPKSSPVIKVAITVKQSPQKVIRTITSPLRHVISSNDESFCSEDMDISDVVSPLVSNMSPKMPFKNAEGRRQQRKKGDKLSCLSSSTMPSSLRDITNQVDLYEDETEMSFLSSNQDGGCVSDGEEDSDRTQQLEPTLGGLLKGLEAEGAAAGKCFSAQTQNRSDGIEEDRKEDHTMELEPSLGGVLANLAQTEHPSPSVVVISRNDSSNSFSIVPDSHVGLTPSRAERLKQTIDDLMLLNTPDTLTAKSKDKSGSEEVGNSNSNHTNKYDGTVELVVESEDSTCLSPSSVEELKEDEGNDVVITTTDGTTRTSSGRGSEIDESTSPLALSVVMEEDESDLRHSTEFTESSNKRSSNGEADVPQPLSADICGVNKSSMSSNVNSKAQERNDDNMIISRNNESLDDDSKSMSSSLTAVPKPNPPPPLSFESLLNFCMPEEYTTEVQSALLPVSSSVKESSGKRGDMVRTLVHAVELHLLTYATEELLHQLVPEGVKQMADALLENKADQPIVKRIEAAAAGVPEQEDEKLGDQLGIMPGQVKKNVMTSLFTSEMRWIDMLSARKREVASEIDAKAHSLLRGKAYLELLDKQLDTIEAQVESECLKKEMEAKEAEAKAYAKVMADIDVLCKEKEELEERMKRQEEVQVLRKRCAEAEEALAVIEKDAYEEEENVIDLESKISLIRGLHNWGNPLKLWSSKITIPFVPCCSRKTIHAFRATLSDSGNAIASVISLTSPTAGGGGPPGRRKRALLQKNMDVVPMSIAAEMISALVFDSNSGIFSPSGAGGSILSTVKCFSDIPFAVTVLERLQGRSNSLISSVDWLVKKVGLLCTVESCGKGGAGNAILHIDLKGKGTLSFVVDAGCASLCFELKLCVKEGMEIDEVILNNAKQSAQTCMARSGGGMTFLRCVDLVCQAMGLSSICTLK